jgi:predicted enzyme related to lactoylglutathione lyase
MKIRPVSVAVVVKDRKASAKWFKEKLGLKVLADEGEHWTVVGAPKGGMQLHLCEFRDGKGPTAAEADAGIMLTVDKDLKKAHQKLAKKGVEFEMEPTERPWGWEAKIRDPDGNIFWLMADD